MKRWILALAFLAVATAVLVRLVPAPTPKPAVRSVPPSVVDLRQRAALTPCPPGLGSEVPDLTLGCLGGGPSVRLRATGPGRPTLVNIYGSWCGPCQEEMPTLVAFSRLAGTRVALVGIDTEDTATDALTFARDLGQHWPAFEDPDKRFLPSYGAGPPVTLFLDAQGHVVHVASGAFRGLPELRAAVARYLRVTV